MYSPRTKEHRVCAMSERELIHEYNIHPTGYCRLGHRCRCHPHPREQREDHEFPQPGRKMLGHLGCEQTCRLNTIRENQTIA